MAANIVERADYQIKAGNVFCTLHSFDGTKELVVFPIGAFRVAVAAGQRTLNDFDLDAGVSNIAAARLAARKRKT